MAPLQALLRCAAVGMATRRAAYVPTPSEGWPCLACLLAGPLATQPLLADPATARWCKTVFSRYYPCSTSCQRLSLAATPPWGVHAPAQRHAAIPGSAGPRGWAMLCNLDKRFKMV